jgi:hypothetical protein
MRRLCVLFVVLVACTQAAAEEQKSALEADPKGWVDLLDGGLKNWRRVPIPPKGKLKEKSPWSVSKDGKTLTCDGVGYHEMLLFDREIADGVLHVEWRFVAVKDRKGYNSGVYVRNSKDGAVWHQAQVGADVGYLFGTTLVDGKPARVPANKLSGKQRAKPIGEWNTFEITAKGKNVTLWVNGAVTAEWKSCEVPRGYLGLEAEGYLIEFRNVKLKETK